MISTDFAELLLQKTKAEGFPLAGVLDIELSLTALKAHIDQYDQWLASGFAGSMEYLKRGRDRRTDPRFLFPPAKSILCVATPYSRKPAGAMDPTVGPRYARYLQGKDYHLDITERLEKVMNQVAEFCEIKPRWKICVDTSAVLERSWAALAGLGWIGKNTLLIHPRLGSYLFLGHVLIDQETGHFPKPMKELCGHCHKCLEACPTQALLKPRTLDATQCISYWTLEKKGDLEISEEKKRKIGPWVAGCDICQEVCPFNLKPAREEEQSQISTSTHLNTWKELLEESEESYIQRMASSALKRVKPFQFKRNLAIALKNTLHQLEPEQRTIFAHSLRLDKTKPI